MLSTEKGTRRHQAKKTEARWLICFGSEELEKEAEDLTLYAKTK